MRCEQCLKRAYELSVITDDRDKLADEVAELKRRAISIAEVEAGWRRNGGRVPANAHLVECWFHNGEFIVIGYPDEPDCDGEPVHNCDAMGCGGMSHVVARFKPATEAAEVRR